MYFLHPNILYGLFLIAIPIIIHFFNFRRYKKIYFSNVEIIKKLDKKTEKRRKLKQLLILISRILAISFIVLAFARPVFKSHSAEKIAESRKAITLFIDNSYSMDANSGNISLLTVAKQYGKQIIDAYDTDDVFQVLTCDFEGKHQRYYNKEEINLLINDINFTSKRKTISEVYQRIKGIQQQNKVNNVTLYVISDFQKNAFDFENLPADSTMSVYFIPVKSTSKNNLHIDSVWFETPFIQANTTLKVSVLLANSSDQKIEKIPLRLYINGQQKSISSIDINPEEKKVVEVPFSTGNNSLIYGHFEIDDYPITFDDKLYFACRLNPITNLLVINDLKENVFLNKLYANDSLISYEVQNIKSLNYTNLNKYNTIILNEISALTSGFINEIAKYVDLGGNLVVLPNTKSNPDIYKNLTTALKTANYSSLDTTKIAISSLQSDSPLFQNVFQKDVQSQSDLGSVSQYLNFSNIPYSAQEIMQLANQKPFLLAQKSGNGYVYLFATAMNPNSTDFVSNPLFVPTFYNIAINTPATYNLYYTIGSTQVCDVKTEIPITEKNIELKAINKNIVSIPDVITVGNIAKISINNDIIDADNYYLLQNNEAIATLAFNYNRLESDLKTFSKTEINDNVKKLSFSDKDVLYEKEINIKDVIISREKGNEVWKICIIMALVMLLTEILLIRLLK